MCRKCTKTETYKFKFGDNITATCKTGTKHNGTVIAYITGTDTNGERVYWCRVDTFAGLSIWAESEIAPRGLT